MWGEVQAADAAWRRGLRTSTQNDPSWSQAIPSTHEGCLCFDHDNDGDIDHNDFLRFHLCASGTDVPANPACGN